MTAQLKSAATKAHGASASTTSAGALGFGLIILVRYFFKEYEPTAMEWGMAGISISAFLHLIGGVLRKFNLID